VFESDEAGHRAEVAAIEKTLTASLPQPCGTNTPRACGATRRSVRPAPERVLPPILGDEPRIQRARALIKVHFEQHPFDAFELIGGYKSFEVESNMLQVARYHEERARGRQIRVVGASDAHGCENGALRLVLHRGLLAVDRLCGPGRQA